MAWISKGKHANIAYNQTWKKYKNFCGPSVLNGLQGIDQDVLHHYGNVEMVICVGCIKRTVESVAESMISKYNIHNNELRYIYEETAQWRTRLSVSFQFWE